MQKAQPMCWPWGPNHQTWLVPWYISSQAGINLEAPRAKFPEPGKTFVLKQEPGEALVERSESIVQQIFPGAFYMPSPCWKHKTMKTIQSSVNSFITSFIHTFLASYYVLVEKTDNYAQEDRLGIGRSQGGCLTINFGY